MSTGVGGRVPVEIRPADSQDVKAVIDLMATALRTTEVAEYLVPHRAERDRVYRRYFDLMAPWFFERGVVQVTANGSGAAMWAVVNGRFAPDIADYDARLAVACGEATGRFVALDAAMHAAHPDVPHAYLAFLAVDPDEQNIGIGSALLAHQHTLLDQDGLPAFVEATGVRNAGLYRRHGYADRDPYQIGDGSPPLYPMWRDRI